MLDRKFILDNEALVRKAASNRGVKCDISAFITIEQKRRQLETNLQKISAEANQVARDRELSPNEKRARGSQLKTQKQKINEQLEKANRKSLNLLYQIPNLIHSQTPLGPDETSSREISRSKTPPPTFDFKPKDHVELGKQLGLFDFKNASQTAGAGFYYLLGEAVRLELALQHYALDILLKAGFTPVIPPELVHEEILMGAGYRPRGEESNSYAIEGTDLHLIATSEIPLCGMFANQIIKDDLPIKLAGVSHCFRSERAAGRATRGLFRVHQFNKVEMLVLAPPNQSEAIHEELLTLERDIFDGLEIPYRVIDVASGDLGMPAFRKYDLEAWMPGRQAYGEITSASNCTDYQARRLKIRWQQDKEKIYPHILNGTGIAVGRAMIALMENHQQKNGSISIPKKLQPYLVKKEITLK